MTHTTMPTTYFEIIEQRAGAPLHGSPEDAPFADGFYWSRNFTGDCCWGPFATYAEAVEAAESGTLRGDGYGGPESSLS